MGRVPIRQRFSFGRPAKAAELWGIDTELVRSGIVEGRFWLSGTTFAGLAFYSARFEEGKLRGILASWERYPPTLGRVIECLGEPDYYDSVFYTTQDATGVGLGLWYGSKGIVVGKASFHSVDYQPTGFRTEDLMNYMTVVSPSDAVQMLPNVYPVEDVADGQAFVHCALKSWPGSAEATQIQSADEILPAWRPE